MHAQLLCRASTGVVRGTSSTACSMRPVRRAIDLLLPPRCLSCTALLPPARDRRPAPHPMCPTCEAALEPDGEGHLLADGVVAVAAFAYADPLAGAIKRVKTDALREGARALAGLLPLPPSATRTWVPAPPSRRRRRGLDLAQVLAGPGARPLLVSARRRPDQPDLDAAGRRAAAVGAYLPLGGVPRAVTLVDDVRATGATLLAAATALRHAGAERVLAITLAASAGPPSAGAPPAPPAPPGRGSAAASGRWS